MYVLYAPFANHDPICTMSFSAQVLPTVFSSLNWLVVKNWSDVQTLGDSGDQTGSVISKKSPLRTDFCYKSFSRD